LLTKVYVCFHIPGAQGFGADRPKQSRN